MTQTPALSPLFTLTRGDHPEVTGYGYGVITDHKQLFFGKKANLQKPFILRSLLKPWQFLNLELDNPCDYMALGFASHSGQYIHQQKLKELRRHYEVPSLLLQCPASWPMDTKERYEAEEIHHEPHAIFHPCSGKHILHLAKCREKRWEHENYKSADHPIQKKLIETLTQETGAKPLVLQDSCGLPTVAMPVQHFLSLSNHLLLSPTEAIENMLYLWKTYPRLVGGINRLDSDITEDLNEYFVAKEAADGLLWIQSIVPEQPITILIKLAAGHNQAHLIMALWSALHQAESPYHILDQLKQYILMKLRDVIPESQNFNVIK